MHDSPSHHQGLNAARLAQVVGFQAVPTQGSSWRCDGFLNQGMRLANIQAIIAISKKNK